MDSDRSSVMPDRFDRLRGLLTGLPGVMQTQPATIIVMEPLLGTTETYIVETFRQRDERSEEDKDKPATPSRDTIFLQQIVAGKKPTRLAIPATVADTIARQRDGLTTRSRKAGARKAAATRKARGIRPAFLKKGGAK